MKFTVDGQVYQMLSEEDLDFGEAEDLEEAIGMTLGEFGRLMDTCTCTHFVAAHRHEDDSKDMSCLLCDCSRFTDVVPVRVARAFVWLSIRRDRPDLTFDEAKRIKITTLNEAEPVEPPKDSTADSPNAEPPTSSD